MAINTNIDNQFKLEYSFQIAEKKRSLTFSDECAFEIERVNVQLEKLYDRLDKIDDNEVEEMSVDDEMDLLKSTYEEVRGYIIAFFDKYFGDNAGQEIYEYYHESTRALATTFGKIYDYLNKVEINDAKKD